MNTPSAEKPYRLRNTTCIYCLRPFDHVVARTTEHVLGKGFYKHVSFAKQWNLIAYACKECNNHKSLLEDHVAAVTMHPPVGGYYPDQDVMFIEHSRQKAEGSIHPDTGDPVLDNQRKIKIGASIGSGVKVNFELTGPPRLIPEYAYKLAYAHVQAFVYLTTYNKETRQGSTYPNKFNLVGIVPRTDWGNARLLAFVKSVSEWPHVVHAIGANGHFKLIVQAEPVAGSWMRSWAIEWNKSYRLYGYWGSEEKIRELLADYPIIPTMNMGNGFVARQEVGIADDADVLFNRLIESDNN